MEKIKSRAITFLEPFTCENLKTKFFYLAIAVSVIFLTLIFVFVKQCSSVLKTLMILISTVYVVYFDYMIYNLPNCARGTT